MINHHNLCLTRLQKAAREVEVLYQENTSLRSVNHELNKQLNALILASLQSHFTSSDYHMTPFKLVSALRELSLNDGIGEEKVFDESPTRMMKGVVDVERVMLPKGISVRSNEYVKMMSQAGASHRGRTWGPTRPGNASQLSKAKVYVQ